MVRDANSLPDQASEKSDAEVWLEVKSSEDGQDKAKDASLTEEELTDGLDAHGAKTSEMLESSEDITRASEDALSGNLEDHKELSAGAEEPELSEDSSETEEDALSGLKLEEDGSEPQDKESEVESSEDGPDKDKDASNTLEETQDGLDADGSET